MNTMIDTRLESKLLKGSDYKINGLTLKNYKLGYLFDVIGLDEYYKLQNLVTLDKEKIKKEIVDNVHFTEHDIDREIMYLTIIFLETFIECHEVNYNKRLNHYIVYLDENKEKFIWLDISRLRKIFEVFKLMYCVPEEKDEELEFATDEAEKALKEWLEEERKIKEDIGNSTKDKVTLTSIISYVANKSPNLNVTTIWNLTVYQLLDTFYRLSYIDNYDNTMMGVYTGNISLKDISIDKIRPDVSFR